jgi:outer membrane usher protein
MGCGRPLLAFLTASACLVSSCSAVLAAEVLMRLQLDVVINGVPSHMIGSFVLFDDRRIGATANELKDIGLDIGPRRFPEDIVRLDDIPGVKYEYDEPKQLIRIAAPDALRKGQSFDLSGGKDKPRAQSDWGVLLNYDLLGVGDEAALYRPLALPNASLTFDGRVSSPQAMFEQTGIVAEGPNLPTTFTRLSSLLQRSDQDDLITYNAGDVINGGLAWTRPIRVGGLQAQSNFALRPDLITMPLLSLGGVAAVPSTVDVYVNNTRAFSQEIAPGPFNLTNIPVVSGGGNAEVIVTDASGHVTKTTAPFFASAALLAPGLMSWSLEGGFPRLDYGSASDDYSRSVVGSATLRRGIFDWLTVEGHTEDGAGLLNGGVGAAVRLGTMGVASLAVAGSNLASRRGAQFYASIETRLFGLSLTASSQRATQNYADLASATAQPQTAPTVALPAFFSSFNPPTALDNVTLSSALPFDPKAVVGASFIHAQYNGGNTSEIVSASYSRALPFDASLAATAFRDFGTTKNTGVLVSLTFPLGGSASVSTQASRTHYGSSLGLVAAKPLGPDPGSLGWTVQDSESANAYRAASLSYRSAYGVAQAGVSSIGGAASGSLELRGAIVAADGDLFLTNWIDDGFAVVDVGAPNVAVFDENRPVGKTDASGKLLVPALHSYERNRISIDPSNLPADVEVAGTDQTVVPANHGGAFVNFKLRRDSNAALVTIKLPDGADVPAGSEGRTDDGADFVVGYDGQAFLDNLKSANSATIAIAGGACRIAFNFAPTIGEQARVGPLACQPIAADSRGIALNALELRR